MNYQEFLFTKKQRIKSIGYDIDRNIINPILFDFQKDIVKWAVNKGRCAVFADTGLGKTFIQLEWGRIIGGNILIFAPLSVSRQTIREGKKIGIEVKYIRNQSEITEGIFITNYENIESFNQVKNITGIFVFSFMYLQSSNPFPSGNVTSSIIKFIFVLSSIYICTLG